MIRSLLATAFAVLALAPDGSTQCATWDPGFAPPGCDARVLAFASFDDGSGRKLYAAGDFTVAGSVAANRVARWDGASWSPLGLGLNGPVYALAVHDDGSGPALYVGGLFQHTGNGPAKNVARWNGTGWSPLGAGTGGTVEALAVYDDGGGPALYAGGWFATAGGAPASRVARWDGSAWSPLGTGVTNSFGSGSVHALLVHDDGSGAALYAAGDFTLAGGTPASGIARWDGASWSAVGTNVGTPAYALAVHDDGSGPALHAGGGFGVKRWNGASWVPLGAWVNSPVRSLESLDLGAGARLYAGREADPTGWNPVDTLLAWDGAGWTPLGSGVDSANVPYPIVRALHGFDDGSGAALFVGGWFVEAGGAPAHHVARWDGAGWSSLGQGDGLDFVPHAFAVHDDGTGPALYAGGTRAMPDGTSRTRIARLDGASWSPLGGGIDTPGGVRALAAHDDGSGPALYVGGAFGAAGGAPSPYLARWNGTVWSAVGGALDGYVQALVVHDDGTGPALYAGGSFTHAGGVAADRIARWDGSTWSPLGAGVAPFGVLALAVHDDGSGPALYATGEFTSAGGAPANRIAKWDGSTWSALGAGIGSGTGGGGLALHGFDDGSGPALYVGGAFTVAGGAPANRIARWDGLAWSALGAGTNGPVYDLAVHDDGSGPALYAAGEFLQAGGATATRLARWNGASWSALGSGPNETVEALGVFDDGRDGDEDLYLGGSFELVGAMPSLRVAQRHGCANEPVPFCFGDGSLAACPCNNQGFSGAGCDNSAGTGGAVLLAAGTLQPDTLVLTQHGELASSLSIFLQGDADLASPLPFGDGLRCIGGHLARLYVANAVGGSVSAPQPGDPSISARSAQLGDPIAPGTTRSYQVYYRDPAPGFCPSGGAFNVGTAIRIGW